MRLLKRQDIEKLITMEEVIGLMRDVFASVGNDEVVLPDRTVIEMANKKDAVLFMPGYIPELKSIGIKIVTVFPGNLSKNIPAINAQVLLNDPDTGEVICVMEGGLITAMRTAAVSAVATDHLAVKDADSLGLFGAGVQAKSQIKAIMAVRPIRSVRIYDVIPEAAQTLAGTMASIAGDSCSFQAVTDPAEVVIQSRIIVTATTSPTPVFNGSHLQPGTHINAIGSFKPHVREVDDETIGRARLFVDSRVLSLIEAGDLIIPIESGLITREDIQAELGELVLGKNNGRESDDEITFFKSVGMAVQDMAVAKTIYKKAEEHNIGTVF
jgi:ornithine cyclodeaminase/alanine dehydrogenase-like protein (mu-crystallin family)